MTRPVKGAPLAPPPAPPAKGEAAEARRSAGDRARDAWDGARVNAALLLGSTFFAGAGWLDAQLSWVMGGRLLGWLVCGACSLAGVFFGARAAKDAAVAGAWAVVAGAERVLHPSRGKPLSPPKGD